MTIHRHLNYHVKSCQSYYCNTFLFNFHFLILFVCLVWSRHGCQGLQLFFNNPDVALNERCCLQIPFNGLHCLSYIRNINRFGSPTSSGKIERVQVYVIRKCHGYGVLLLALVLRTRLGMFRCVCVLSVLRAFCLGNLGVRSYRLVFSIYLSLPFLHQGTILPLHIL